MPKKKPNPSGASQPSRRRSSTASQSRSDISQPDTVPFTNPLKPGVQRLIPAKPIPNPPPKRRRIAILLSDPDQLSQIRELITTGASISTTEAILEWPPNTLTKLLDKGKLQKAGPYRQFYIMFRAWAGQARHRAETQLNVKSPEKWLDRSTSARLVESDAERQLALNASSNLPANNIAMQMGAEAVLKAFSVLAEQGIDINDALRKDQIHISNDPEDKDE